LSFRESASKDTDMGRSSVVTLVSSALWLAGCSNGVETHPVRGTVKVADGDVSQLVGSHVEFAQQEDPLVRASGKIEPDGSFAMETLHEGKVLRGVLSGTYKARIVLADESDEGIPKRGGRNPIHPRFFDFETSKLSFQVPGGDYTATLSKK
jgi:hypothetical protein